MFNTYVGGASEASDSSQIAAGDQFHAENLHLLLEGTHHRGELRSCYISHPFAIERHQHFREFNGAQRGPSSDFVAGASDSVSENQKTFGASGLSAVPLYRQQQPGALKDQSATGQSTGLKKSPDLDLAHRLQSCHICDPGSPSQTVFDGMEQDLPQNHEDQRLHDRGLGHYYTDRSRDVHPSRESSELDLMQT